MRDPGRIDGVIREIHQTWIMFPDLRLGQLIVAATNLATGQSNPFYVEEVDIVAGLRQLRDEAAKGELRGVIDTDDA